MAVSSREIEILATPIANVADLTERAVNALTSWIDKSGRHEALLIEALTVRKYDLLHHTPDCGKGTVRLIEDVLSERGFALESLKDFSEIEGLGSNKRQPEDRQAAVRNALVNSEIVAALHAHRAEFETPVEWVQSLLPKNEAAKLTPEFLKAVLDDPTVKREIARVIVRLSKPGPK